MPAHLPLPPVGVDVGVVVVLVETGLEVGGGGDPLTGHERERTVWIHEAPAFGNCHTFHRVSS
jgi:hypothetical protein